MWQQLGRSAQVRALALRDFDFSPRVSRLQRAAILYKIGILDRFNDASRAEITERVKHMHVILCSIVDNCGGTQFKLPLL